ncbi:hypothetical protein F5J12DRAFT_783609 [Pisolithus orientalis]|uniref:uncharacterized protein n=1 Tax=Pisolithus orientalis TaxID=936130 RepID=UPI0022248733|nr:uncharacterized protein F5J12DRAFT_783609 [Pisolithus orientalis]KAI6003549.1 hypothetical protein F5J12DRAFT_783609 [Pisolithus orientalis]
MATSSMLGHILTLCRWAVMGTWIMVGSWNIQLASFHAGISGPDGSQSPGYFQWFRKHTSGILLGWYDFLTFPVSWVRSHVIARDQQGVKAGDSCGSEGIPVGWYWAGICFGQIQSAGLNSQLMTMTWDTYWPHYSGLAQLARMDDTLQAIYSGSEGTPVGFYWAGICSGQVQSAGPNSQSMAITWDTYWPYARGLGQMPSLW